MDDPEAFKIALLVTHVSTAVGAWWIIIHLVYHLNKQKGNVPIYKALWQDSMSHFLCCISISITVYFIYGMLVLDLPGNVGIEVLKSRSACRAAGFLMPFAFNIAAMWCCCASHFFLRDIRGQAEIGRWKYHLVAWPSCCALSLGGYLWAHNQDLEYDEIRYCGYFGEHNERMLALGVIPMLCMWGYMVCCLVQSAHFLKHYSTGANRLRMLGGKTYQQYFLAVLVFTWAPFMIWQTYEAFDDLKASKLLSQIARMNLSCGGLYTCVMYCGVVKVKKKTLGAGLTYLDAKCIHFAVSDLEDGDGQLWRNAQEQVIEENFRAAVARLFPSVKQILQSIAPDAPDSYASKATTSIAYHCEYSWQQLLADEQLLYSEVSLWASRCAGIKQRRLTGLPQNPLPMHSFSNSPPAEVGSIPISMMKVVECDPDWLEESKHAASI